MPSACLHIRGLKRLHLGPIDFDLNPGEIVSLSGASGAGKTVLLRAIADLDPNEGTVELESQSRESMPAPRWREQVCYLPADSGWWDERVGAHFTDPDKALPVLERLLLPDDILDWPVARLSTGEKQRLALARVLLLAPKVMLLDEPTSGLDFEATVAAETEIKNHIAGNGAIMFVSHDSRQVERLATRQLTIKDGNVDSANEQAATP